MRCATSRTIQSKLDFVLNPVTGHLAVHGSENVEENLEPGLTKTLPFSNPFRTKRRTGPGTARVPACPLPDTNLEDIA